MIIASLGSCIIVIQQSSKSYFKSFTTTDVVPFNSDCTVGLRKMEIFGVDICFMNRLISLWLMHWQSDDVASLNKHSQDNNTHKINMSVFCVLDYLQCGSS